MLCDEHGRHPPDEELAALEGEGATEVRPVLVPHHALKNEFVILTNFLNIQDGPCVVSLQEIEYFAR